MSCVIWSCGGDDGGDIVIPPVVDNTAPTTPSQIYPANNDLCIDNDVNFQWDASTDKEGNPISYIVEVSKNESFSPLEHSKSTAANSVSISLEKGVVFYWRVKAVDSENEESNFSSVNQFYSEGEGIINHLPFSPAIISPALNAAIGGSSTTLQWNSTDVDTADSLVYDVYFDTVNPPVNKVSENQSADTFDATLSGPATYYWQIVVKDDKGGETIGQIWQFSKN